MNRLQPKPNQGHGSKSTKAGMVSRPVLAFVAHVRKDVLTVSGDLLCMAKSMILGKAFEYRIITELLQNGFEVFLPTVDDRGVDCLIKNKAGQYIEMQIKGRRRDARNIFNISPFTPRSNYFFAIIPTDQKTYIVPSVKIHEWLNGKSKFYLSNQLRAGYETNYTSLDLV